MNSKMVAILVLVDYPFGDPESQTLRGTCNNGRNPCSSGLSFRRIADGNYREFKTVVAILVLVDYPFGVSGAGDGRTRSKASQSLF